MKTKAEFDEFVKELIFYHRGEGVREYGTRCPAFVVHRTERVYGFDFNDNPGYLSNGDYIFYESLKDCLDGYRESEIPELINQFNNVESTDIKTVEEWLQLEKDTDISEGIQKVFDCELTYYNDQDLVVGEHLTMSAAEDFVQRNKYNYGNLRISVESFSDHKGMEWFLNLIMDGKIIFQE